MGGLANGFVNLFKSWGKGIGNAADNFLLDADARKAITDEVTSKFQPKIDLAYRAESRRADNIKDLDTKLNQAKQELKDAQKAWKDKYNTALADAKNQRQTDIDTYDTQLKAYQDAVNKATAGRQSIVDQLYNREATYDPYKTLYTDVATGDRYILSPITNQYINLTKESKKLTPKGLRKLHRSVQGYETRLLDTNSNNKVINAFDDSDIKQYGGKNSIFDNYLGRVKVPQYIALRDADNQITRAQSDLTTWQGKNTRPQDWNDANDLKPFEKDFKKTNGSSPIEYSFNGKNYSKKAELDKAYKDALNSEQKRKDVYSKTASGYISRRDAEIAKRIQDAKDMNKAKLALMGTGGAGALYAGARAIYGGDNTDNIDNGKPDPDINVKNISEGQALLNDEQQSDTAPINTGFDPDKADAIASAAYDQGVEDGNSIESSDDLGNNIGASTGGHTIDDRLFELIKAMQDPYKADAVANYIYSRRGNDPELQRLGWRAWLNKYYGDSLRSMMNIDPSGYKGMHVSGGL